VISQEGFDGLPQGVIPVEVALVGKAIDLRFRDLYQGQADPAALARAMCLHPCRGGGTGFSHCESSIAFRAAMAVAKPDAILRLIRKRHVDVGCPELGQ
jgi:hypothetical protein